MSTQIIDKQESEWAIECCDVCVEFGNLLVLDDVTFTVGRGVFTAVVGPNGGGKSTLFNALTSSGAESANYPFCTIEPNIGIVPVMDERLTILQNLITTRKVILGSTVSSQMRRVLE